MTQVKAYVPGLYARSAETAQQEDLEAFLGTQREAGMDYLSDGLLGWEDLLQPFARSGELQPEPRTPQAPAGSSTATTGRTRLRKPLGEPFFRTSELPRGRWFATLPSPRTAEAVIGPQLEWLAENGCAFAVLRETALSDRDGELSALGEALEALESPLPLAIQLPGDSGALLEELVGLPVDAVGVDLHSTDPEALPRPFPKTLLAGVSDAGSPALEEPREMAELGRRVMEGFEEAADLHFVPNGDLRSLPPGTAREKVLRLGAAARMLRGG